MTNDELRELLHIMPYIMAEGWNKRKEYLERKYKYPFYRWAKDGDGALITSTHKDDSTDIIRNSWILRCLAYTAPLSMLDCTIYRQLLVDIFHDCWRRKHSQFICIVFHEILSILHKCDPMPAANRKIMQYRSVLWQLWKVSGLFLVGNATLIQSVELCGQLIERKRI